LPARGAQSQAVHIPSSICLLVGGAIGGSATARGGQEGHLLLCLRLQHPLHAFVYVLLHQLDLSGVGLCHALDLARVQLLCGHLLLLRLQ
jgi:hypothetical protein